MNPREIYTNSAIIAPRKENNKEKHVGLFLTEKCESCWSKVEAALAGVAELYGGVVEGGEEGAGQDGHHGLQAGQHGEDLAQLTGGDTARHLGSDGGREDVEEQPGHCGTKESFLWPADIAVLVRVWSELLFFHCFFSLGREMHTKSIESS